MFPAVHLFSASPVFSHHTLPIWYKLVTSRRIFVWAPAFAPHHPGPCIGPKSLSSRQFYFWKSVAPPAPRHWPALCKCTPPWPPWCQSSGSSCGILVSLFPEGWNPLLQIHSTFLQSPALYVSGKWSLGRITKKSYSIPPGRWVCSGPILHNQEAHWSVTVCTRAASLH